MKWREEKTVCIRKGERKKIKRVCIRGGVRKKMKKGAYKYYSFVPFQRDWDKEGEIEKRNKETHLWRNSRPYSILFIKTP